MEAKNKCVFLDRDGTINKHKNLITSAEQFELEDYVPKALRLINESSYLAILITNQSAVARGLCSLYDLEVIHNKMTQLLAEKGAYLDDIFYCPHHPEYIDKKNPTECICRKPKTGLVDLAIKKYNIDPSSSYFVGDMTTDILTGINAKMHTILLKTGVAGTDKSVDIVPEFVADNLLDAVKIILR